MDFQFIFDRKTQRHFIELSSEYKVIEKALNEEFLPNGASLEQLRTMHADIGSLNGKRIGIEWSVESNGDDVMVFHNNYADRANITELLRQIEAEVMPLVTERERTSDHLGNQQVDSYADLALSQEKAETAFIELGSAQQERTNLEADAMALNTNDHIALCAKEDLLYVIEKWISFIEE